MIQGKLLSYGDNLEEVFEIRRKVFIDEQSVPENIEFDEFDQEAIHVLVYDEVVLRENSEKKDERKTAVATGRIVYDGESCRIGHIAVLEDYRNMMYGDFTVRMLLNRAFTAGINEVFVYCKSKDIEFFEKIGFTQRNKEANSNSFDCCMIIHVDDLRKKCKMG